MANLHAHRLRLGLKALLRTEEDPSAKSFIEDLLSDLNNCVLSYERQLLAAKMIGVRNPFFDGDEMGYPDDDFDDEDDSKTSKKH